MVPFQIEYCACCGTEHRLTCPLDLCKCGHHWRAHRHGKACSAQNCRCKKLWRRLNMVGVEKEKPMTTHQLTAQCECGHPYSEHSPHPDPKHNAPCRHHGGQDCGCRAFTLIANKYDKLGMRGGTMTNPNIDRPFNEMIKGAAVEVGRLCTCDHGEDMHPDGGKCWRIWHDPDRGTVECDCAVFEHSGKQVVTNDTTIRLSTFEKEYNDMAAQGQDPCRCGHGAGAHTHVQTAHQIDGDARCLATSCPCGAYVDAEAHYWPDEYEPDPCGGAAAVEASCERSTDYICHCGHDGGRHAGDGACCECVCSKFTSPTHNPERDPNFWFPGTECAKAGCSEPRKRHGTILCQSHWQYWSSSQGRRDGWERIVDFVVAFGTTPPVGSVPPDDKLMPPDASMDERCARCGHCRYNHKKPSAPLPGACDIGDGGESCPCGAFVGHDWAPPKITVAANVAGAVSGLADDRAVLMAPSEVLDPEFAAMHTIAGALDSLDQQARYRVLNYIKARFQ